MAASRQGISGWFDDAMAAGAEYLIVVCDTYDHDDYPILATAKDFWERHDSHGEVMEVYDLALDKTQQMAERRAHHPPPRPGTGTSGCRCGRIRVGLEITESRNWDPSCPEHGLASTWWNSPDQTAKREADSGRLRDIQQQARQARRQARNEQGARP